MVGVELSSSNVTKLNGDKALAFTPVDEFLADPEVPEIQSDFSERYLKDWILALQHSVRSNAAFQSGVTSDVDSNRELGRVLDGLEKLLSTEEVTNAG
jgi:hypothetical protein